MAEAKGKSPISNGSNGHIKLLALDAIDLGFKEHMTKLFLTYLREATHPDWERTAKGARRAIEAYKHAIRGIEEEFK